MYYTYTYMKQYRYLVGAYACKAAASYMQIVVPGYRLPIGL